MACQRLLRSLRDLIPVSNHRPSRMCNLHRQWRHSASRCRVICCSPRAPAARSQQPRPPRVPQVRAAPPARSTPPARPNRRSHARRASLCRPQSRAHPQSPPHLRRRCRPRLVRRNHHQRRRPSASQPAARRAAPRGAAAPRVAKAGCQASPHAHRQHTRSQRQTRVPHGSRHPPLLGCRLSPIGAPQRNQPPRPPLPHDVTLRPPVPPHSAELCARVNLLPHTPHRTLRFLRSSRCRAWRARPAARLRVPRTLVLPGGPPPPPRVAAACARLASARRPPPPGRPPRRIPQVSEQTGTPARRARAAPTSLGSLQRLSPLAAARAARAPPRPSRWRCPPSQG
mmetsp:Transcript_32376/g.70985  ORF Transcript_32376/g.70985 Transcript_32376/m.70985 type:complete len:341 (-) Transcript_32376:355-1377(-)